MPREIASKIDDRYEVLGELGRGGMGVVYKASDIKMDRLVAIKVMTADAPGHNEYLERFLREAKSIAKMQHPNIVVVYDFGYHGGAPYIAMEYVEGVPLDKVIASRVSLTPLTKVDYVVQVCHALHYAHQLGIIHRDVKPGNIMVLEGGRRVKLLDFGIARAGAPSKLSKSGLAMGTTCYMSPEQTRGKKDLDARADIFSAGVVLYELLAGRPPWTGDSDYEVMTKIIHEPVPPLPGASNYPGSLDRVFELALAKDPGRRYETAEELALALAELEVPLKERALEEALVQFEHGDLLRANDLVSQILRIDTRHREAIELRARLQQVAQLQHRSEQVRQLRTAAEEAVGQKRYTEALAAVEQAITIDSANTELFHYRELIRNEVKRREDIRKKLELARHAQEMNDLSTAQELVERALEADPTDTQARMMKSSLEQERRRQQLEEIGEEASRALTVRAFSRAAEFIQQLESIDPNFARIPPLKRALAEGEAEEQRRVEIENLIRDIRRSLESGNVPQCLSATQQALARFPGEPRLIRLRAQAETLRDAAQREETIQKHLAQAQALVENGQSGQALVATEAALRQLGSDHRLQSLAAQLRQTVEREQQVRAEQSVLVQARKALQASDFESAVKILTPARTSFPNSREISEAFQSAQAGLARKADAADRQHKLQVEQGTLAQAQKLMESGSFKSALKMLTSARLDFPDSKQIAEALQAAQGAIARKAEMDAQDARNREMAEALEHALAGEPDPDLQVGLAEEAVRRIPGNTAAERALERVRERQGKIADAVDYARKFEQAQRYAESIQQWEKVRKLWPECPNLDAQIARLSAAQKPATATPAPPSPTQRFSATSIMAGAPTAAPSPAVQPGPGPVEGRPEPHSGKSAADDQDPVPQVVDRPPPIGRSKKLFLTIASTAVVAIGGTVLYLASRRGPTPAANPPAKLNLPAPAPKLAAPEVGTLIIQANVEQVDIFVDGTFKGTSEAREKTISIPQGNHSIRVEKRGYATPPQQQVEINRDRVLSLPFTLTKSAEDVTQHPIDTYLVISTRPGAKVSIDGREEGTAQGDGSFSKKVAPEEYHIKVSLDGYYPWAKTIRLKAGERKPIPAELNAVPKPAPVIALFKFNPPSIQQGQSAELQWKVQNATEVKIDQLGTVQAESSRILQPTETKTYTLTATGEGGTRTTGSATINVAALPKPLIKSFFPVPKKIHPGDSIRLVWTTENATEALLSSEGSSDRKVDTEGSSDELKPTKTTTYILTIKGAGGLSDSKTAEVIVEPAPTVAPPASPSRSPSTAVVQPTVPPDDSLSNAVKEVNDIIDRYKEAYNKIDIPAIKKIWPQMPKETEKDMQNFFNTYRGINLYMSCKKPIIKGDSAEIACPEEIFSVDPSNDRQSLRLTQVFTLQKDKNRWHIVSVIIKK